MLSRKNNEGKCPEFGFSNYFKPRDSGLYNVVFNSLYYAL